MFYHGESVSNFMSDVFEEVPIDWTINNETI